MAKTYETIISVLDRFSAPILGLEDKLAKLGNVGGVTQKKLKMSPTEKLWKQLSNDVSAAKSRFGELGDSIGEMGSRMAEVLPMLGALGGGASIAGLLEMAHATSEAAEALRAMSLITGVAVPQLQSLDFAAKQTGVSADLLGRGLEKLNINLGKAAEGQDKNALALFHKMGIELRDSNGHVKTLTQVLPQLEASFEKTKDPTLRAAMAMTLFGKSGEELLPFLTQGPDAIAALQEQFQKFGYSFSGEDESGLKDFQDAWNDAQLSVQGLTDEISARLAPVLAPLLEDFATFVAQNRDLIAADLAGTIKNIGDGLDKIDWKGDAEAAERFVSEIATLIDHDHLGGFEGILGVIGAAMAVSFLTPLLSLTVAMGKAGVAAGAFALDALLPLSSSLIAVIPEIRSFRDVMAALDIVMDANPLGVAVAAAAALAAVGLEVYENWKPIEGFFEKVGGELDAFAAKAEALDAVLGFSSGPGDVPRNPHAPGISPGDVSRAQQAPGVSQILLPTPPPAAGSGKVDVAVRFQNPPAGLRVSARGSGLASKLKINGVNGTIDNHR